VAEFFWTAVEWEAYDRKTAHLSLAQDGAYRRLLSHYYRTRKPLPANAEILLRVCRAFDDSEKAAVLLVVGEFFTLEADGYHNRRADEELAKQAQVSEKRREAGKKGAESTNSKRAANGSANERQMPTQLQSHIKPISIPPAFVLPAWIPEQPWNDFLMMRDKQRKPPTVRAKELIVIELEKLLNQGHDPAEVLNQSTKKSYLDVYPVEKNSGANRPNQPTRVSAAAVRAESNDEAIARVLRERHGDSALGAAGGAPLQRNGNGRGSLNVAENPIILPPASH
jgi:uncharacterized protein YdaU (DUF1376 family)